MQKIEIPDPLRAKQLLLAKRRLLGSHLELHERLAEAPPPTRDEETEYMTRAVDYELSEQEREEIVEIDRALARIDHGRWGQCDVCGHDIDPERLAALPEARECLACAARRDRLHLS